MKITLRCASVIRSGPERDLVDDYLKRASGLVGRCGIHSVTEQQIDLKKFKNRTDETKKLLSDLPPGATVIVLDERGKSLTSRQVAKFVETQAQSGIKDVIVLIGGADGFDAKALPAGTIKWSFGAHTWPHKLVRVMLAEQMYRALSILAGSPYHRD